MYFKPSFSFWSKISCKRLAMSSIGIELDFLREFGKEASYLACARFVNFEVLAFQHLIGKGVEQILQIISLVFEIIQPKLHCLAGELLPLGIVEHRCNCGQCFPPFVQLSANSSQASKVASLTRWPVQQNPMECRKKDLAHRHCFVKRKRIEQKSAKQRMIVKVEIESQSDKIQHVHCDLLTHSVLFGQCASQWISLQILTSWPW